MKDRKFLAIIMLALAFFSGHSVCAQEPETPSKIEVGITFSSLTFNNQDPPTGAVFGSGVGKSEAGFGGRFTLNLNRHVALEGEGNLFPHEDFADFRTGGRMLQGQFGVKAGKRFGKFGVFAKARPGLVSFSKVLTVIGTTTFIDFNGQPITVPVLGERRKTYFSMDLGGVLEFYPSSRVLTRIDVGDTIIHYPGNSDFAFAVSPLPSRTTHNLQVTAGIGFRLMSSPPPEATTKAQGEKRRFEVGAQFSSLGLRQVERFVPGVQLTTEVPEFRDTRTLAGFGGRFTYNVTPDFALEMQTDFYPRENFFINNARAGGRTIQGQAGVKAGKRFEKFGIFAKARPGIVSFSKTVKVEGFDPTFGFPIFRQGRKSYFSMDVGGVLEFYPSPRIVTRFDGGDTMIRYRAFDIPIFSFPTTVFFPTPAETLHNFQFSAGVGYRF